MKKASIFGKYLLLERLNVGGMAEVFIAKTSAAVEGVERFVAIKKILPTMAEDEDFIRMFIDEARISVQLNHANIVHIHELGKADETYFIAMEYVAGKDVRTLLERYRKRKEIMPTAQAVFIASKMCEALDYAHRKKDARGQELGIIHRDVSPQNILVSYEGEVKIIDFGIAKAANRSQKTQAGILKGKFGYMSPEQVRGQPLDRRSDIFAVGVLLYEMITGEKLFTGESDYSVLEKVRNAEVPAPRKFNPNIPPGLERVLNKALAREQEQRYQWAADLHEDLVRFLVEGDQVYTSKHLSGFMKDAFAAELDREAQAMERYSRVGGPEELDDLPRRSTPAPAPMAAQEELDESEDQVDKTQLIDPSLVDSIQQTVPPSEEEPPHDATRADAVNPFADEEKTSAPPSRAVTPQPSGKSGPRAPVVIGEGQYAGATVVGQMPTAPAPANPVAHEATRIFDSANPPVPVNDPTRMFNPDTGKPAEDSGDEPEMATDAHRQVAIEAEDEGEDTDAERRIERPVDGDEPEAEERDARTDDDEPEDTDSGEEPGEKDEAPEPATSSVATGKPTPIWMERRIQLIAAGGGALLLLILLIALTGHKPKGQGVLLKVTRPAMAKVTLDGAPVENNKVTLVVPGKHEAIFSAPGYVAQKRAFDAEANKPPLAIEIALEPVKAPEPAPAAAPTPAATAQNQTAPTPAGPTQSEAPKSFTAAFDSEQDGVEISVEGKSVGKTPDAKLANLSFGKTYHFTAKLAGYKSLSSTFSSSGDAEVSVPVSLEKVETPAPAEHAEHHEKAPAAKVVTAAQHSAPPSHSGSSKARSKVSGWLACSTHPAGAEIIVDNHSTGRQTPAPPSNPITLPVGIHTVVFKMGSKKSEPQKVTIEEKETAKLVNVPVQ
jgi:serine/threonine protein kinase